MHTINSTYEFQTKEMCVHMFGTFIFDYGHKMRFGYFHCMHKCGYIFKTTEKVSKNFQNSNLSFKCFIVVAFVNINKQLKPNRCAVDLQTAKQILQYGFTAKCVHFLFGELFQQMDCVE